MQCVDVAQAVTIEKLGGRVNFVCADRCEPFVDSVDLSGEEAVKGRVVEFVLKNYRWWLVLCPGQ